MYRLIVSLLRLLQNETNSKKTYFLLNSLEVISDSVHCALFFSRMKIANFDFSKKCQQIAEVTKGLSGREISKIAIAWQVRAYENCNKTDVKCQNEKFETVLHMFTLVF